MANDVAATTRSSLEMADKIEHFARGSLETLVTEVQEHNRRLEVLCKYNAGVLEQAMKMADKAEKHEEATREQNRVTMVQANFLETSTKHTAILTKLVTEREKATSEFFATTNARLDAIFGLLVKAHAAEKER